MLLQKIVKKITKRITEGRRTEPYRRDDFPACLDVLDRHQIAALLPLVSGHTQRIGTFAAAALLLPTATELGPTL